MSNAHKYLCVVQNFPNADTPADDKLEFMSKLYKCFGDSMKVINSREVESKSGRTLFCEMLVKSDSSCNLSLLPRGLRILMELQDK